MSSKSVGIAVSIEHSQVVVCNTVGSKELRKKGINSKRFPIRLHEKIRPKLLRGESLPLKGKKNRQLHNIFSNWRRTIKLHSVILAPVVSVCLDSTLALNYSINCFWVSYIFDSPVKLLSDRYPDRCWALNCQIRSVIAFCIQMGFQ